MTKRFTYEEVKEYIESFGYELLSTGYKNNHTKLKIKCPKGHECEMCFKSFKKGNRCFYCHGKIKYEYEDVKRHIESFGYKLLSDEYINFGEKMRIMCTNGHEFLMDFRHFKRGQRCSKCGGTEKYTIEEVKKYIEINNYKLLSDKYINNKKKLKIKCSNNHIFEMSFDCFKNKEHRCPICNVSKGEQRIMDWLNNNNIKYIYDEPYFNGLLSPLGNPLRPDFIIEDRKIWIEYDGEFHFGERFKGDSFEIMQEHDIIKDMYAIKNKWRLIRIPYWEFNNIEEILEKELK